ncbi:cell division protein FtsQ/DivIB [Anaerovorax odorimutans]|uniref:cell division protein FtsQ/DivIB n=1 Tax=Anaerovorax odorimutans TaxID=109327 RepID=UPI0004048911|nr:FtsQ-type POTRA domain-containing protein [Anaerovorax odorimutans]
MEKNSTNRKKKKRKKKRYLLKFFIFIVLCTALYLFLTSSLFDIQKIKVENNNYYTSEQVISIAKAKAGKNLFKVSTSDMKERLLKDSYIKSVKVKRRLPDTIKIIVEEREEYAAIPYGEEYVIIDSEGMVLRKVSIEPKLTILLGMTVKNIDTGTPLEVEENSLLTDTLSMLKKMEKYDLYFKKIDISNIIIKAYIYDQLICEGTPENILNNMETLQEVLYDYYSKGIKRGTIKVGADGYFAFSPLVE